MMPLSGNIHRRAQYIAWLLFICVYGILGTALAQSNGNFSQEQLRWLESDDEHPTIEVNEGELKFIAQGPDKPEHQHKNDIWITTESIKTGWARLDQCHTDLDAVPLLQIVYNKDKVRDIRIISHRNIGQADVIGHRVILHDISRGSKICLEAYSNVLKPFGDQQFRVKNGPFMRQFLDGYYPITVILNIHYPGSLLKLVKVEPAQQTGWQVKHEPNQVRMRGRFEGRLKTNLLFTQRMESP